MSDPIREPEYALHPSPQEYIQGSPLSPDQMGFLRFFNGTTAPFPVHISLDHKPFAAALLPGFLTCYDVLEPGKRNISLQDGTDPTILLLQESLLFPQGGCSTVILSDSSRTGLQLFHLRDMSPQCSNFSGKNFLSEAPLPTGLWSREPQASTRSFPMEEDPCPLCPFYFNLDTVIPFA